MAIVTTQNNVSQKQQKPRGCMFFVFLFLIVVSALCLIFWLLLGVRLSKGFAFDDPEDDDTHISVGKVSISLLSDSVRLEKLAIVKNLDSNTDNSTYFEVLDIHGISIVNIYRLALEHNNRSKKDATRTSSLKIFDKIMVQDFKHSEGNGDLFLSIGHGVMENIEVPPAALTTQNFDPSILFGKLMLDDLYSQRKNASYITVKKLAANGLTMGKLASLDVRGLEININEESGSEKGDNISLAALSMGGIDLGLIYQGMDSQDVLSALRAAETLDLAQLSYSTSLGKNALIIDNAVFDHSELGGGKDRYLRSINFSFDLNKFENGIKADVLGYNGSQDIIDLFGSTFDVELRLELDCDVRSSKATLNKLSLFSSQLGRLSLAGEVSGVSSSRAWVSSTNLLSAVATWRLKSATFEFVDHGFMLNFYRYLDKTEFKHASRHSSADNIMRYYIKPLAGSLEAEGMLANLPVVVSEVELFLNNPNKMKISLLPEKSFSFSLAGVLYDVYDIIEKLNVSLEVNDRAPVMVAVKKSIDLKALPSQAQPLNELFTEEDIK